MQRRYLHERRKYIRLDSVFPVEIYLRNSEGGTSRLVQAFTRDVSVGGLCLFVNDPDDEILSIVHVGTSSFDVTINMPITHKPIEARVKVAWCEVKEAARHKRLLVGVSYETINPNDRNRIMAAARRMKWLPRIAVLSITLLIILFGVSHYREMQLIEKNRLLIERFYRIQEKSELYKRSANVIDEKYEGVKAELAEKLELIHKISGELEELKFEKREAIAIERAGLEGRLNAALAEKANLEKQIEEIAARKEEAARLLIEAKERRRELEEATVNNMYQWLKSHQNKFTGLIMSFEGDASIKDWAFTYDQSLASLAFLISDDLERIEKILAFFKNRARKRNGGYLNAYNCITGEPAEEVVHIGPNVWIGITAIHYVNKTGDKTYLSLAEDIAGWVISLKDSEGGVKGGPRVSWYSTEHNLDAYALFNMLYAVTSKDIYRRESASTLRWIREHTYSKKEGGLRRGKGDATIATDTLAWAIASIGPAALLKEGMDPGGIMRFAEENCLVSTNFTRPSGDVVMVNGFDFAKAKNIARGGVVSCEWTAQMAIAFKMMSDFYAELNEPKEASIYGKKADLYLSELDKMVISSPSPSGQGAGCLPYASQPNADTGHGWRTPSGMQTGSVSGTAYTIFAKRAFNPLSLD